MSKRNRVLSTVFLFLSFLGQLWAQEPIHDVLDTDDGLPSNEVYWVHQDQKGDLWFCTDNGVARYNGIEMKVYNLENGLPDNVVFMVREDQKGRLWFSTYSGGLFRIEGDSVIIPPFNKNLVNKIGSNFCKYYFVDENDTMYLTNHQRAQGVFKLHVEDSIVKEIPLDDLIEFTDGTSDVLNNFQRHINKFFNKMNLSLPWKRYLSFNEMGIDKSDNDLLKTTMFVKWSFAGDIAIDSRGKVNWASVGPRLLHITEDGVKTLWRCPSSINSINVAGNRLLINTWNSLYVLTLKDSPEIEVESVERYLDKVISCTHIDRDGVYWLTTVLSGVIRMPEPGNCQYQVPEGIDMDVAAKPIHISGDTIHILETAKIIPDRGLAPTIVGGPDRATNLQNWLDSLPAYNLEELQAHPEIRENKSMDILHTIVHSSEGLRSVNQRSMGFFSNHNIGWHNGYIYIGPCKVYYRDEKKRLRPEVIPALFDLYSDAASFTRKKVIQQENHYIVNSHNGFGDLWEDTIFFNSRHFGIDEPIPIAIRLGPMHYLYGSHQGLFEFKSDSSSKAFPQTPLLDYRIEDIKYDSRGILYVGSRGGGLVVISPDTIIALKSMHGLSNNMVREMILVNDTLWLGTDNGLNSVYFNDDGSVYSRYHWINRFGGNNPIMNLVATKGQIVIFRKDKLYFVKRQDNRQLAKPRVILEDVRISGRSWGRGEEQEIVSISGRNNNLEFSFRINSLLGNPFVYYEYQLQGFDKKWIQSTEQKAIYNNLPFGDYKFKVRVINARNVLSENTEEFAVVIKRPLILTLWFQLLLALSFTGLTFLIISFYFRRKNQRLMREREMISSNIFALKMQINPHFIFNALNSIQYFIASDRGRSANDFLSRFSELIRDILRKANQTKVTIREELKSLENYIKLEDTRKKNGLKWKMDIDSAIDTKRTFIPSMILQPIVENAIWHGLAKVEDGGELGISIHLDGDYLICRITDNGPGIDIDPFKIENSGEKLLHKSVGLSNVIQRLKLISKMEGKSYDIHFDNIYTKEIVKFRGTIVTLKIPAK